ncbi:hypothetical protein D3C81_2138430 [compost metagenome]
MFQLQADIEVGAVMAHGLVESQARTRALFAQDPRLLRQVFDIGTAQLGQRMLRCAEHHQFVLDPRLHFQVRVVAVTFD